MDKIDEKVEELRQKQMLDDIGMAVFTEGYTLAKAMREGASVSEQAIGGFGNGAYACGWTAAYLAVKARGLLD